MKDLEHEDLPIYERIQEAGNRGIQTMDLKNKLQQFGYNTAILNRILKKLEKKGLVKKLKSLQQKNKQVWLLMEIEPSQEVTGGLIGEDSFDLEKVEIIQERILEYLAKHG